MKNEKGVIRQRQHGYQPLTFSFFIQYSSFLISLGGLTE